MYSDDNKMLMSPRMCNIKKKGEKSAEVSEMLRGGSVRNNHSVYRLVFLNFWRENLLEFDLTAVNVIG